MIAFFELAIAGVFSWLVYSQTEAEWFSGVIFGGALVYILHKEDERQQLKTQKAGK